MGKIIVLFFALAALVLGSFSILPVTGVTRLMAAQSAREIACEAHKEAKQYLYRDKYLDQAGGDPRQAAILICTGKYGQALAPKCIAQEEKILRQQIHQVEAAIAKDCR